MVLMDDGSWVIESLDSLWFFSHVFSSSSTGTAQFPSFTTDENASSPEPFLEEPSKPISQTLVQIPDHQAQESPRCSRCGELETEPEMWKPPINMEEETVESPKYWAAEQKEERRKKKSKRCKRSTKQRRQILGELDLCFDGEENCGGFGSAECKYNYKMPPLDDNIAMKEHLKSWAYAVACTVR